MNDIERAQIKRACADFGIEYRDNSYMCLRELNTKIALRALRKLSRHVADSGDDELYRDFHMLMNMFARYTRLGWDQEDAQVQNELSTRWARANRKCPYTAAQYDAAVAQVGTKQEELAKALDVDRKTLRKYGRPAE